MDLRLHLAGFRAVAGGVFPGDAIAAFWHSMTQVLAQSLALVLACTVASKIDEFSSVFVSLQGRPCCDFKNLCEIDLSVSVTVGAAYRSSAMHAWLRGKFDGMRRTHGCIPGHARPLS